MKKKPYLPRARYITADKDGLWRERCLHCNHVFRVINPREIFWENLKYILEE